MDAYTNYILQTSNARLDDLRREAAEYRLSRAARAARESWWSRVCGRLRRRRAAPLAPAVTVSLPAPVADDEPLRRTA